MPTARAEFEAIKKTKLYEKVAQQIQGLIRDGLLKPGDKLNERCLAQTLHVSRTPLRDGMKLLAGDGLIDLVPNRGAFVANPNPREVEDMLTALRAIEAAIAELACLTASDEAIAAIRDTYDRMLKALPRRDRSLPSTSLKLNSL